MYTIWCKEYLSLTKVHAYSDCTYFVLKYAIHFFVGHIYGITGNVYRNNSWCYYNQELLRQFVSRVTDTNCIVNWWCV